MYAGLMKLATMAGVVGVGLSTVYQSQTTLLSPTSESVAVDKSVADATPGELLAQANVAPDWTDLSPIAATSESPAASLPSEPDGEPTKTSPATTAKASPAAASAGPTPIPNFDAFEPAPLLLDGAGNEIPAASSGPTPTSATPTASTSDDGVVEDLQWTALPVPAADTAEQQAEAARLQPISDGSSNDAGAEGTIQLTSGEEPADQPDPFADLLAEEPAAPPGTSVPTPAAAAKSGASAKPFALDNQDNEPFGDPAANPMEPAPAAVEPTPLPTPADNFSEGDDPFAAEFGAAPPELPTQTAPTQSAPSGELTPLPEPGGVDPFDSDAEPAPAVAPAPVPGSAATRATSPVTENEPVPAEALVPLPSPADDAFGPDPSEGLPAPESPATLPPAITPPAATPASTDEDLWGFGSTEPAPTRAPAPVAPRASMDEIFEDAPDSLPRILPSGGEQAAPGGSPAPVAVETPTSQDFSDSLPGLDLPPPQRRRSSVDDMATPPAPSTAPSTTLPAPAANGPEVDPADPFASDDASLAVPSPSDMADPLFPEAQTLEPQPAVESALPATPAEPARVPAPVPTNRSGEPSPAPTRTTLPTEANPVRSTPVVDEDLFGDGEPSSTVPRGQQQPRLSIEKQAPERATVGEELVYAVLVRNTGDVAARQVLIEDRIPRGTELIGTSPQAELTGTVLRWKIGELAAGEQRRIAVKVRPLENGSIGSVARVSFVAEVAAEILVTKPELKLEVQAPREVRVGDKAEFVFRISNTGTGDAPNAVLRSLMPAGVKHPAGQDIEYSLGTIKAGESRDVRLEVLAADVGQQTAQCEVIAEGGLRVEQTAGFEALGEQLLLSRTAQPRLLVGRTASVTNSVTNEGRLMVDRVEIREVVPAGLEVKEVSNEGRYDSGTRTVSWTVGPLAPGEAKSVQAKYLPKVEGDHVTQVTARGSAGSVATVDAPLSIVGAPALSVEGLAETRLISVGESIVFKAKVENRGTAAARGVALRLELPPELEFLHAGGPTQFRREGQVVVFDAIETIAPNADEVYELELRSRQAGESRIVVKLSADYLSRPLVREEPLQVVGGE